MRCPGVVIGQGMAWTRHWHHNKVQSFHPLFFCDSFSVTLTPEFFCWPVASIFLSIFDLMSLASVTKAWGRSEKNGWEKRKQTLWGLKTRHLHGHWVYAEIRTYCIHGYFRGGFIFVNFASQSSQKFEHFHFNIWLFIVLKTSQKSWY